MGIIINGQNDTIGPVDNSMSLLGTVSIGGTMTIEDFTNIDSVGLITARNGIDVTGGTVTITTGANSASPAGSGDNLVIKDSDGCGLSILSGNGNSQNIYLGSVSDNDAVRLEGFYNSGSPYFSIYTAGSQRLRITSAGNIGIGEANPSNKLTVKSGNGDQLGLDNAGERYTQISLRNNGTQKAAIWLDETNDDLSLYAAANYSMRFLTGGTESARISSAGKVGINEDNPQRFLHITGNDGATGGTSGNSDTQLFIENAGVNGTIIEMMSDNDSNAWIMFSDPDAVNQGRIQYDHDTDGLNFYTAGTERLRINSAGKLLINSTANSDAQLLVRSADKLHPALKLDGLTANGFSLLGDEYQTDESNFTMGIAYSSASLVTGWGVKVSPTASNEYLSSQDTYSTKHSAVRHDGDGWKFLSNSSNQTVTTDSVVSLTERLRITSAGQMGLGTNDPNSYGGNVKLAVANTSGTCGLSIVSATNGDGNLYYADGTSGDSTYRGYIRYNHTLDQFRIGVAGAEKLRITDAGMVGINMTPGTAGNSTYMLQMYNAGSQCFMSLGEGSGGNGPLNGFVIGVSNAAHYVTGRENRPMIFATNDTERLRITTSGQIELSDSTGIKLSAKTSTLYAQDGSLSFYSTNNGVYLNGAGTNGWLRLNASGAENDQNSINIFGSSAARIELRTNNVERLRVHSGGQVTIGKTSTSTNNDGVIIQKESNVIGRIDLTKSYSGTANAVACFHTSTYVGGIQYANSSVNFYNASDYRLKENVVNLEGAITRIKQLSPKRFNYIAEGSNMVDGFLAHEAQTVVPEAVSGTHNEVDENGDPVIQCLDQSKLVPLLTAALKEAIGKIETLEAAVTALQGS